MKKIFNEFKQFISKGDVMNLAVGVMIGGAFSKIVSSVVNDLFMPMVSLLTGGIDFSNLFIALDGEKYANAADAAAVGVSVFAYGSFIKTVFDFLLLALIVFLFVKFLTRVQNLRPKKAEEPQPAPAAQRHCPYCKMEIAEDATRCPHCTSVLE